MTKEIPTKAWVVVADSSKALFLENVGEADHPHLQVRRKEEHENPPTREQGTDRPGRLYDTGPNQRSALSETDWHALERDRFASDLADLLYRRVNRGDISKLILVASPEVLGALRRELHVSVRDRVIAEVPKVLTNLPIDELERRLPEDIDR